MKEILKLLCPPILQKTITAIRNNQIRFSGDYASWNEAQKDSTGYDTQQIAQQVLESSRKVTTGEAIFERDSVCFFEENYRWPLLSCLLLIANNQKNQLSITDFGGALGSLYFQHRALLSSINQLNWSVVEQPHFVDMGQKEFQNEELNFHFTLAESIQSTSSNTVLLSSVLQYLEYPQELLKQIAEMRIHYILIDRTPFIDSDRDRLTVQSIPKNIYAASYPAWFFSAIKFDRLMQELGYQCICNFDCEDNVGIGTFKGFLFEKV